MSTGELKPKVESISDATWSGGIANQHWVIAQLKDSQAVRIAEPILAKGHEKLRWSRSREPAPEEKLQRVRDKVLPLMKSPGTNDEEGEGPRYRHHSKAALTLIEIGGHDAKNLLSRTEGPLFAHLVRGLVGTGRAAAQPGVPCGCGQQEPDAPPDPLRGDPHRSVQGTRWRRALAALRVTVSSLHAGRRGCSPAKGRVIDGIFKQLEAVRSALVKAR